MDTPTTQLGHSRRRLTRTGHVVGDESTATTASSLQAGPSRLPELTQLMDVEFSDLDKSSDELGSDDHATPRLRASKLPGESETQKPVDRLRALLARVPNGSPSTTPVATRPPHSLATYESDSDAMDTTHATAAPSEAQTSLRGVFSHALRPPGDTPQKPRPRRNSIDTSEVESPRTERAKHKAKRKSLSDEEVENSYRTSQDTPASAIKGKGTALTSLEVLRQRIMNHSKAEHHDRSQSPTKQDLSDDTAELLRELNSSRTSPPAATSTPHHSLQMSQFQMQSNLLDHDSEMQRAFDVADSYEFPTGIAEPGNASEANPNVDFPSSPESDRQSVIPQPTTTPSRPVSFPQTSTSHTPLNDRSPSIRNASKATSSSPKSPGNLTQERSTSSLSRAGSRSSLTARTLTPRTRVVSSPRLSDASSSRSSSFSQADYRERLRELDQDEAHRREREWNKPNRTLSRPTSSLSLNSTKRDDRQRTHSLTTANTSSSPRPYQLSPAVMQALRRHSSLNAERQDSPTSSQYGSQEEYDPLMEEIILERERNWNSPRPVWHARRRADSLSSTGSLEDVDGDDLYNPSSTASRLASPRSIADIRARVRLRSTPDSSASSPRSSPLSSRLLAQHNASMTSPSHNKRHSLTSLASPSTSTGRILGRDIAASPSANRSAASSRANRMSWHSSTQSMSMASTATPGDRSSLRAPRRSLIPTPSPRKAKPVPVVQFPPEQPPPEQVTSSASEDESQAVHDGGLHPPSPSKEDGSPQELTPTLKTIPPPPVDSPEPPPTPIAQPLEVSAAGPQDASQPEFFESEVDAPYNSTPLDPSNHELPSFTATPPRDSSSRSYSKLELKSPSHAGVPELPGPPTDESDSDVTWQTPAQTRLFPSAADSTAFKTPRPPGAWADTPAARRRRRSYSDSISFNPLAPASSDGPNWTAIQTPRPPGGWLATPAPARNVQYVDQSVETDTELESDAGEGDSSLMEQRQGQPPAGFSTPVSSFAKGKYHDAQTPAAPGGWVPTPAAARKSVRFDAEPSETSDVGVGTEDDFLFAESKGLPPVQLRNPLQTPPDSPQLAPTSPSRGKKGPGIRVLDAFGNETREENNVDFSSIKTPRRQPIRMVDALGNAVEDSVESVEEKSEGEPAGTKEEVLSRMRQGLDELVHEIHDLDRSSAQVKSDLAHIKELDAVSINSREKRRKLVQQMRAANDDVKDRLASLTNGGTEHLSQTPATVVVTRLPIRWFWIVSLAILQIALAVAMYRYYTTNSRDAFLTTYYDPFNPLLHLYTQKSRRILDNLHEPTPWISLLDLLRQRHFREFGSKALDNLSIHLVQFQAFVWEKWGEDVQSTAWPPT